MEYSDWKARGAVPDAAGRSRDFQSTLQHYSRIKVSMTGWGMRVLFACVIAIAMCQAGQCMAQERLIGDVNGDGTVDFADFIALAENFGKTDGAVFDPSSCADTAQVVVLDTIEVTHLPTVTVEWATWPVDRNTVQSICEWTVKAFSEWIVHSLDSDIVVQQNASGPKVLYNRDSTGRHIVWLNVPSDISRDLAINKILYQFAHEYTHILSNYYQTRNSASGWFEETIAVLGSLCAFNRITTEINKPETRGWGRHIWLDYAIRSEPGHTMEIHQFRQWFADNLSQLRSNCCHRSLNSMVAHQIFDYFRRRPETWNIIRYMTYHGPVSWSSNQDFSTYLYAWYLRTPKRWQYHVLYIAQRFYVNFPMMHSVPDGSGVQ